MKVIILLACLTVVFASHIPDEWTKYKLTHRKRYNSGEDSARMKIYLENKKRVEEHNELYRKGLVSYTVALNKFADLLPHEALGLRGYNNTARYYRKPGLQYIPTNDALPGAIDWRTKGYVTEVKNQEQCGSCWAFSTTGSLEGQHFRKTGQLVSLSEQNLVDCSTSFGNEGCNGGLMDYGFAYIKSNGGIDTEESYPYEAVDGRCRFNKNNIGATDVGYVDIKQTDEDDLQNAVATVGPVSVAIDASNWSFQLYSGGVYNEQSCSEFALDHGVLAVGYGTEKGKDYWLVKNSWGAEWGIEGYIKMSRNTNNQCGIATQASYPLV